MLEIELMIVKHNKWTNPQFIEEQFVKTDSEIVTNIPSLPCHFFVFTNDFKFVGGGGFSDSSSLSSSSPSLSSLSLLQFVAVNDNGGLVGLSSDSEKETNSPNSKLR
ncbi:hypothetical protein Q3G72_028532 [Acer saccharum]|nr:hypothetical protein Q3G72_028532 [Acer saccharum]